MFKFKKSLYALAGMALLIGAVSFVTPSPTQGQGNSGNAPPAKDVNVVNTPDVNVVNTPTVKTTELFPVQPFQRKLTIGSSGPPIVCETLPADKGLIVEFVAAFRPSDLVALPFTSMLIQTTAGGHQTAHPMTLERQQTGPNSFILFVNQPLRLYADAGSNLCFFTGNASLGGNHNLEITFSGQLVSAP